MAGTVRLLPEEAERELLSAVVSADRQTLAGRNHEDRVVTTRPARV